MHAIPKSVLVIVFQ